MTTIMEHTEAAATETPLKLNLGAGTPERHLPGYLNIDRLTGGEVFPLIVYPDGESGGFVHWAQVKHGTCAEVRASHVLEHLSSEDAPKAVAEWARVLKPGGVLKIAVPDMIKCAQMIVDGNPKQLPVHSYIYGSQTDANDFHKVGFNDAKLRKMMADAGLVNIQPWKSEVTDCAALEISLNLQGVKPLADGSVPAEALTPIETGIVNAVRSGRPYLPERIEGVRAAIAMPRLSFTHSNFDMMKALVPLGIPVAKLCGIWWGQQLTPLIEKHLAANDCKYILTLDYDSRFSKQDVKELYRLMEAHPEADAIAPVQIRRGDTTPLMTIRDPFTGKNKSAIPADALKQELLRVHTAHFGCSFLRVDALRNLPKPWFMALPDDEGGWKVDKGCVQEDIFFWRRWEDNNRTLYVAPHVRIGHGAEHVLLANDDLSGVMMELDEYEKARDERDAAMEAQV
jgi:predicted SAM-dependent methyltransferase